MSWLGPFSVLIEKDGEALPQRPKLILDSGIEVVDDPDNKATRINSIASGGTGTAGHVSDLTALRAISQADISAGSMFYVGSDPTPWVYDTASGAGFADDGKTIVKLTAVNINASGRFYRATASPVLPTIAALRLAVSGQHQAIHVQAYAALGDQGGGIFDYDSSDTTSADDGGVVIVAGARRYKRRISGHRISAKWFGARGSGDDRAMGQRCIDYCYSLQTNVPSPGANPESAYTAPRAFFPSGNWEFGRADPTVGNDGHNHGLELPGIVQIEGENGTNFLPRSVAVTVNASNDTFTTVGGVSHNFVLNERVMIRSEGGAVPAGSKGETPYYVISSSLAATTFKLSATQGGAALDLTGAGSGTLKVYPMMATLRWQVARGYIEGIQFVGGFSQIALAGPTSTIHTPYYGFFAAFFPSEFGGKINRCRLTSPAGPAIWQDMSPVTVPGNYRTFGPLTIEHTVFRGPVAFWGCSDKLIFRDCTFTWDQNQLVAETNAGLPAAMHSGDGLPLGCVNSCDNVYFDHCFIGPLGSSGGQSWPGRNAFGVGMGNWVFNHTQWGDLPGCLLRSKAAGNTYQGLCESAVSFNGATSSPETKITTTGPCLFDVFQKNLLEVYEKPIGALRLGRSDETNAGGSYGIWVDSGSVTTAAMLQKQKAAQMLESNYYISPLTRWRTSTEANGFGAVGGQPWGEPIASGTGIADITGNFEQYHHNRPFDEYNVASKPQENLYLQLYKQVRGGNPAFEMVLDPAVNWSSDSSDSSLGYSLPTFVTGAAGGALGFSTNAAWGATSAAGVYVFSCDILASADCVVTFQYTFSGHACDVAPRKVVGDGRYHRYEFSFYFPGGGATYTFQGAAFNLPAATTMSFVRYKVEKGRKASAYTFPVDDPAAPTKNAVARNQPSIYYTTTTPGAGSKYVAGDRLINPTPSPGDWAEQVCTTESLISGGVPIFRVSARAAPDPNVGDVAAVLPKVALLYNSGSTVNSGDEYEQTVTVTGAKFGDDVSVTVLGYLGSKWDVYARISANDTVKVAVRNGTGSNAAIPTDAAGGVGVSVTVIQHPAFETFFPGLASWLEADSGVSPGGGPVNTWADQSGQGNGAGPQATSSKRPAVVTSVLNGHSVLRGTSANQTLLPISWTLSAATSIYMVVGGMGSDTNRVLLDDGAGDLRVDYNHVLKTYEFLNGGSFRAIGAVANHADYAVLGIVTDDAGNTRLYFNGAETYNAARDAACVGQTLSTLFNFHAGTNAPNGDIVEVDWYKSAHTAAQAIEMSLRLKAKYGL